MANLQPLMQIILFLSIRQLPIFFLLLIYYLISVKMSKVAGVQETIFIITWALFQTRKFSEKNGRVHNLMQGVYVNLLPKNRDEVIEPWWVEELVKVTLFLSSWTHLIPTQKTHLLLLWICENYGFKLGYVLRLCSSLKSNVSLTSDRTAMTFLWLIWEKISINVSPGFHECILTGKSSKGTNSHTCNSKQGEL